jgi:Fe/S biogenesis protein NfuA
MAALTLSEGVEAQLLSSVPDLKGVQDITDHSIGQNPYYAPDESGESPVA